MLTSSKTLLHRSGPLASKALLKPVGTPPTTVSSSLLAKAFFATSPTNITSTTLSSLRRASSPLQQHSLYAIRPFSAAISPNETIKGTVSDGVSSSAELKKDKAGYVTKKLRVLDMDVVEKIKNELKSVDANSDGRIDAGELSALLRRHDKSFTEEEISAIHELFYAGKSGGSVSMERFIEALDQVVANKDNLSKLDNPLGIGNCANEYLFFHDKGYTRDEVENVKMTHVEPQTFQDRLAFNCVKAVRFCFDTATGWNYGKITPDMVLNRTIYLETVAAVPGMCAAIIRHFRSLRNFKRDGGMMQMFLDEANNERMHLLTFVRMKNPGAFFRAAVIAGQFGFGSMFMLSYIISPKFCHRFVGYIEEEAVTTYTKIIRAIETAPEDSDLGKWRTEPAPKIARSYWKLGENGTVLDTIYAVRADEAEHRDVNHLVTEIPDGAPNPISNTEEKINMMLLKYIQDVMEPDAQKPLKINEKIVA